MSLGNLFLFFIAPMGNFLPSSVVNDCCILSSYPAFQDRAWLCFLGSLVSIEGFYQSAQKLSLLWAEQAHLPQLPLTGQVLQTPEHPGGLSWTHKFFSIFLALEGAGCTIPSFPFWFSAETWHWIIPQTKEWKHRGLSTKSCSRKFVCLWLYSLFTTLPSSS